MKEDYTGKRVRLDYKNKAGYPCSVVVLIRYMSKHGLVCAHNGTESYIEMDRVNEIEELK